MRIFEMGMLICFGISWPASIYKSAVSKSTNGKSLVFLILIFAGYISGSVNKIIGGADYVLVFYMLNAAMVFVDLLLYFRNRRLERGA